MKVSVASKALMMASAVALIAGCNKSTDSFTLLKDGADYKQQAIFIPKKIDILWVVDNSFSMETSQNNLATNFRSFINRFESSNYDFHMAVTTTEAWEKQFKPNSTKALLRDGAIVSEEPFIETHSGVFVMDRNTPNLSTVFTTNIKQGVFGNGDERAFESLKQALEEPGNKNFRRDEAFLAVIIVSDEEDFSGSTENFEDAVNRYPVKKYHDFLKSYTKADIYGNNFSVNVISVDSPNCQTELASPTFTPKISTRLPALADMSGGVKASICSDFGASLQLISDSIIELSAVFKLGREPQLDTLSVVVDGVQILQDPDNGWSYNSTDFTITFHGSSVPDANSDIQINFYPKSLKL